MMWPDEDRRLRMAGRARENEPEAGQGPGRQGKMIGKTWPESYSVWAAVQTCGSIAWKNCETADASSAQSSPRSAKTPIALRKLAAWECAATSTAAPADAHSAAPPAQSSSAPRLQCRAVTRHTHQREQQTAESLARQAFTCGGPAALCWLSRVCDSASSLWPPSFTRHDWKSSSFFGCSTITTSFLVLSCSFPADLI